MPRSTKHRDRVYDQITEHGRLRIDPRQIESTMLYQFATLRDYLADLATVVREEYRRGRDDARGRRPW